MKLTDGMHVQQGEGYSVWSIDVEIRHLGGVALVWREDAGWQVKGNINFGTNVASFFLMLGSYIWYVIRLCASRPSHQTGFGGFSKGNGGHNFWGPKWKFEVTTGRQGGRARIGTGGKRSGRGDSPFHADAVV